MPTHAPAPARLPAADRGVRMTTEKPAPADRVPSEPTVRAILRDAVKPTVDRPPAKTVWLCGFAAAALLWASFDPLGWWPLAWVALVPLCVLIRSRVRARWEVRALWACGFLGTAAQIQWMRLGDPAMYPAWLALSAYLGVYFPLFVLACRGLIHTAKVPFAVAVPVVWCGLELCRGHLMTGFGWNLLAHSQWRWTTLIQCADLGGVYTVSAVVAAGGGALALAVPGSLLARLGLREPDAQARRRDARPSLDAANSDRRHPASLARRAHDLFRGPLGPGLGVCTLLAAALLYGAWRTAGEPFPAGPRVALVQTDHPSSLRADPGTADRYYLETIKLSRHATPYRPDLVIWPESAFPYPFLAAGDGVTDDDLRAAAVNIPPEYFREGAARTALAGHAEESGAYLMTGLTAGEVADLDGPGPARPRFRRYGSAALAAPAGGTAADGSPRGSVAGRYDKRHRVVFGEYVPLREELPFLAALTPFTETPGQPLGIARGAGAVAFKITDAGAGGKKSYTVAPLICYEDTLPHLVRSTVRALFDERGNGPDVLAVLSNDGWFARSAEQQQHLAVSLFRAIETRTPLVRASNTGVSAVIDGDGRVRPPAVYLDESGRERPGTPTPDETACVLVADVPLDPRGSLYLAIGDWPAALCLLTAACGLALNARRRK